MATVSVDCVFSADGSVRLRRVQLDGKWQTVGQGRQWLDQDGRHVLIMLARNDVLEIVLKFDTLVWELVPRRSDRHLV